MNKESYSQRQQIIMRRLEKRHAKQVYDALQYQMYQAADYQRRQGIVKPPYYAIDPINDAIGPVIINLYEDAAKMAKKNYVSTKRFGSPVSFIDRVINYFKRFLLIKVVAPISNTTVAIIDNIIQQALRDGWGVEKTAKYLETAPITKVRARMIVRTESTRATNFTQMMAADDEVYQMQKTWIAIEDKRTRTYSNSGGRADHTHNGVDGQKIDLEGKFSNGLKYPGDPDGSAAEVINCRCTMGYNVKRNENGRPVKKENIQTLS